MKSHALVQMGSMKDLLNGCAPIKGKATVIRKIKESMRFISLHCVEDRTIGLIVAERKRDLDLILKAIEEAQQ